MSGLKNLINKYKFIAKTMPEERQKEALVMANEGLALVLERLGEGIGADGVKFPPYSTKVFPWWLLDSDDFNSSSKVKAFKKKAKKSAKKDKSDTKNQSYKAFRKAYGVPTDKRTHTLDGDMLRSVHAVIESHDKYKTSVTIKSKDDLNQNKLNWNSNRVGISLLKWSKSEQELISELNRERVNKKLRA